MGGMEMMLKAMGLDPEQIKQSVGGMAQAVEKILEQMNRIESQNAQILAQQTEILNHLKGENENG